MSDAAAPARYFPEVFNAPDEQRARQIILTPEGPDADTETRWAIETPYLIGLMGEQLPLQADTLVIDYGCGIGRIARAMIEAFECSVIGVDISPNMRVLANDYVRSERFLAVSPAQFDRLVAAGMRADAAASIWVLQHCLTPTDDLARIERGLAPSGRCFVLNMSLRAVPAVVAQAGEASKFMWARDGVDVGALLRSMFHVEAEGAPDRSRMPNTGDADSYWMRLRRRDDQPP